MIDIIMRRVWDSPWTQAALTVWFLWGASSQHGWPQWLAGAAALCSMMRFLSLGKKRWGSKPDEKRFVIDITVTGTDDAGDVIREINRRMQQWRQSL